MKKQLINSKINFIYIVVTLILLAFLIYRYFIEVPCAQSINEDNILKNVSKEYPFYELYPLNWALGGNGNTNLDVKISCISNKKPIDGMFSYVTTYYFEKRFDPLKLSYTWKYVKSNSIYEDKLQIKEYSNKETSQEKGLLLLIPLMPGAEECEINTIHAGICN